MGIFVSPKTSPKWESPLLKSNFDKTTFLAPQFNLGVAENTSSASSKSLSNSSIITVDDLPGADLPGEANRYQVFVSDPNAYSHIIAMTLALKGLTEVVHTNVVRHQNGGHMEDKGCAECEVQVTKLKIKDFALTMRNLFEKSQFPVPLLYDTKYHKVVTSDSAVICRFLNDKFNDFAEFPDLDLKPEGKKMEKKLEKTEVKVLGAINKSIGEAGRATCKEEFDSASNAIHAGLSKMNKKLQKRRYLCGDKITEADIIEFVALFRYDPLLSWVLIPSTKDEKKDDEKDEEKDVTDNRVLISESYPNIWGWLQDMFQQPGVEKTCDLLEILNSKSFLSSFGARIIELGLEFPDNWADEYLNALKQPHMRERLSKNAEKKKKKEEEENVPAKKKHKTSAE